MLQTNVVWMDFPAEVQANEPFRTRLVVWQPCAVIRGFVPSVRAEATTVTFVPYFVVDKDPIYCAGAREVTSELDFTVNFPLDTAGTAPGLLERVYEMRAATPQCAGICALDISVPWVSFGYVSAKAALPPTVVRNAAGWVLGQRDSVGCTRIRPSGLGPSAAIVIENPPDTAAQWTRFVRGYIYQPVAPVCGETAVFRFVYPPD